MIHENSCIFHVLEHGFMYVSVWINTWYIHENSCRPQMSAGDQAQQVHWCTAPICHKISFRVIIKRLISFTSTMYSVHFGFENKQHNKRYFNKFMNFPFLMHLLSKWNFKKCHGFFIYNIVPFTVGIAIYQVLHVGHYLLKRSQIKFNCFKFTK